MFLTETDRMGAMISSAVSPSKGLEGLIARELQEFRRSKKRASMLESERYYRGDTAILERAEGTTGHSSSKIPGAFYKKLVDQKCGYLTAKTPSILCSNARYRALIGEVFDRAFLSGLCMTACEAVKKGLAFSQVCFDEDGKLRFVNVPSQEIIPIWKDGGRTELSAVIRFYDLERRIGRSRDRQTVIEYHDESGTKFFSLSNGAVRQTGERAHFTIGGRGYNWTRPPFVFARYNSDELPLLRYIKSCIDDYDMQKSVCSDMLLNLPNFIYVLRGYGGEDLEEFVRQLRETLAVSVDGDGGVDKLQADPKTEDAVRFMELSRRDIYEFGRGVDTQSDRTGAASGVALRFLYADLDMDCNMLENSLQGMLESCMFFVTRWLLLKGERDYSGDDFSFIFNRDIIISEAEAVAMCRDSKGIVPDELIEANHPWTR